MGFDQPFEVDRAAVRDAIIEDVASQLDESVAAGEFTRLEADVIVAQFKRSKALQQATDANYAYADAQLNGKVH